MKNKGFTLVELLAMLTVLGILMAVAVPNISGILSNHKLNVLRQDALNMVDRAKIMVSKNNLKKPGNNEAIVLSLDYLNTNEDFDTGPNGGKYDMYESFVYIARLGQSYKYFVRLVEKNGSEYTGFEFVNIDDVDELDNSNIVSISKLYGLSSSSDGVAILSNVDTTDILATPCNGSKCTIMAYYTVLKIICKKYDGYYYDSDGKVVTEEEFHASCG